ncbi:hypothetical protein [uncultured Hymenobacter sp.]|uniref:hypothetical protein n=1 Tax=uncultured Hymenobacter sp. TaxID=170016 RepID=UPI0035C9EBCA
MLSSQVDSPTATLLSSTPAGVEQIIIHAGMPAIHFELPQPGRGMSLPQTEVAQLFKKIGMHVVPGLGRH